MDDMAIRLSHGSGKGLQELLDEVVLPALFPRRGGVLEDAAVFDVREGKMAFTSDSFVVSPLEFRGGDIGTLSICGTVNDLAMMGAIPRYISVSLILEEGLDLELLRRMLTSARLVCEKTGITIACGDTKVVERGKADGMFITTSGIGTVASGRVLSAGNAREGDAVLVSGPIGQHGIAILSQRKGLRFASRVISDCAPLSGLVEALLAAVPETKALRDATRGGLAAVLHEIADSSKMSIILNEGEVPVSDVVKGACAFLGLDSLHIANEGRFIAVVPAASASAALAACKAHPMGEGASLIGSVTARGRFPLLLNTVIGGLRPVDMPAGELLPRIC